MKTALILGATGQVGQELLHQALENPEIVRVVAPSRRPLPSHSKLENPVVDFDRLPEDAPWWKADFAVCALGTTLRQAKSRAGFYRVDHDYVLAAAGLTRRAGAPVFGLVSSLGANPLSRVFYLRVKGETERDLSALGFASLTIARPSLLIGGPRSSGRPVEALGLFVGKHLAALLPRRYRAVSTLRVAQALLAAALGALPGVRVIESEQLSG
jgi:uncharacterized protein YbjT (DUF2867 family)